MLIRLLFLLLLLCSACFGPRSIAVRLDTWETEGGVIVHELFSGVGEGALNGDRIALEYTTWLTDGTEIDSTANWGQAVEFVLGEAPLPGWNEGLEGIAKGGKRRLVLPPAMAYGEAGIPGTVPPDATLIFEVERVQLVQTPPPASEEAEPGA